jgi:hypothetical protein
MANEVKITDEMVQRAFDVCQREHGCVNLRTILGRILKDYEANRPATVESGVSWLESVASSIRLYPNGGGDIRIMEALDDLVVREKAKILTQKPFTLEDIVKVIFDMSAKGISYNQAQLVVCQLYAKFAPKPKTPEWILAEKIVKQLTCVDLTNESYRVAALHDISCMIAALRKEDNHG